jgi:hypothetical protein
MGPTGFDSKMDSQVSMPGVVNITRKTKLSTVLIGENNYALAA